MKAIKINLKYMNDIYWYIFLLNLHLRKMKFLISLLSELQYYNAYKHESNVFLKSKRQGTVCLLLCGQSLTKSESCFRELFDLDKQNFFNLLRTCKLHIAFHNGFRYSGSDWPGCEFQYSCCKKVYPDLSMYSPMGLKGQVRVSSWSMWHNGIFSIMSTSKFCRLASKRSSFQVLCSWSMKALTLASVRPLVQGDKIFGEYFTRSQQPPPPQDCC